MKKLIFLSILLSSAFAQYITIPPRSSTNSNVISADINQFQRNFDFIGGSNFNVTTNYFLTNKDKIGMVTAFASNNLIRVYLPSLGVSQRRVISVFKGDSSTNSVQIYSTNGDNLAGGSNWSLVSQYDGVTIYGMTNGWYVATGAATGAVGTLLTNGTRAMGSNLNMGFKDITNARNIHATNVFASNIISVADASPLSIYGGSVNVSADTAITLIASNSLVNINGTSITLNANSGSVSVDSGSTFAADDVLTDNISRRSGVTFITVDDVGFDFQGKAQTNLPIPTYSNAPANKFYVDSITNLYKFDGKTSPTNTNTTTSTTYILINPTMSNIATNAGNYRVDFKCTHFGAAANDIGLFAIHTNGVMVPDAEAMAQSTDVSTVSFSTSLSLPASTRIEVYYKAAGADTISAVNPSLRIRQEP